TRPGGLASSSTTSTPPDPTMPTSPTFAPCSTGCTPSSGSTPPRRTRTISPLTATPAQPARPQPRLTPAPGRINSHARQAPARTLIHTSGEVDHPAGDVGSVVGQTLVEARHQRQLHRHRKLHLSGGELGHQAGVQVVHLIVTLT